MPNFKRKDTRMFRFIKKALSKNFKKDIGTIGRFPNNEEYADINYMYQGGIELIGWFVQLENELTHDIIVSKLKTAKSVMIKSTDFMAVKGNVQAGTILELPSLLVCVMVMISFLAPLARSMAPPTPSKGFPGTAQLARFAFSSTSNPPMMATSICLPRIMAKLSALSK